MRQVGGRKRKEEYPLYRRVREGYFATPSVGTLARVRPLDEDDLSDDYCERRGFTAVAISDYDEYHGNYINLSEWELVSDPATDVPVQPVFLESEGFYLP
jgi:hypothetical protein